MSKKLSDISEETAHVLVVDDDERICDLVCRYLNDHGFVAVSAEGAAEARSLLSVFEVDIAVVDVMMPGESGLTLTAYLQENLRIPVILLTALGETQDRLNGFEAGADDYLPKPFEPMELVMRLQAILRRTRSVSRRASKTPQIGPWVFEEDRSGLSSGDEFLKLTVIEVALIKALASGKGQPLDRETLADLCGVEGGDRTIDVQITRLRKKIETDTKNPRYLQTVRGKGYVLHAEGFGGAR